MYKASDHLAILFMEFMKVPEEPTKSHEVWRISLAKRIKNDIRMLASPVQDIR